MSLAYIPSKNISFIIIFRFLTISKVTMVNEANLNYEPQHPLPQEIQEMNNEDTICKYCGVSYLIHNEMKKLKKLLEEYQKEVTTILITFFKSVK